MLVFLGMWLCRAMTLVVWRGARDKITLVEIKEYPVRSRPFLVYV